MGTRRPPGTRNPRDIVEMKARKGRNTIVMTVPRVVAEGQRATLEPEGWTVEIHRIRPPRSDTA